MESATAETQPVIREKFLRRDGISLDVDVVAIPFVWKDRPAVHVVFRDITRQKETEETLQDVNDLLKGVIESPAGVVIFALDRQYRYIAFNENHRRTMKQIWGADIAPGTSMLAYILNPDDRAKATINFNRALAGESFTVAEAYGATNLERRWYENTYNPIMDNNGKISGLTLFLTDITERKKAEDALRQNEEKYQSIIEALPDAVSVIDKDFNVTFANDRLLSWLHGIGQNNDIIGRTLLDAFPFLSSTVLDEYRTVFLKGKIIISQESARIGDTEIVTDTHKIPLEENGEIVAVLAIIRNITERKVAEEALRESEEKLRAIFDSTFHFTGLLTPEGIMIEANRTALDFAGARLEDVVNHPFWETVWWGGDAARIRRLKEAIHTTAGGIFVRYETEFVGAGNSTMMVDFSLKPVFDSTGRIRLLITEARDITERKKAEDALRESEEKFRGIFDTINDGIHIHEIMPDGKPGKFIAVNNAACQMLQYTREELLEHGPLDFVTEYHSRPFDDIVAELSATGHSIFETGHRRKDGTIVPVEINSHVVNLQGKKVGITVIRDITERRKTLDAIRLANRQLTLLNGITRHDILNNVSMVRGYLKIAEMKSGDPAQAEYLRKMESAIIAIKSQIEFTKFYQDLGTHDPQWIVLDTVMPRSHVPKTITLYADIRGVMLFADPMLVKVFFNLLDNSIRHGERVTEIRVSSHTSDGNLVVVWEDNGTGVAADQKERIFERGVGKNTGLGLFLVREILGLTEITITETGEPGKGARFEITVPKGSYRSAGTQ